LTLTDLLQNIVVALWLPIISLLFYYEFVVKGRGEENEELKKTYLWKLRTYVIGVFVFSIGSLLFLVNTVALTEFKHWLNGNINYVFGGGICIIGGTIIAVASFGRPNMKLESSFITSIGLIIGLVSLVIEIIAIMGG